jgi:uncharacterized protein (UPF0212 family)
MKLFFIDNGQSYDDYKVVAVIVGKDESDRQTIKIIIDEQTRQYETDRLDYVNDKHHTYESQPDRERMIRDALEKAGFAWVDIDCDFSLPGWY